MLNTTTPEERRRQLAADRKRRQRERDRAAGVHREQPPNWKDKESRKAARGVPKRKAIRLNYHLAEILRLAAAANNLTHTQLIELLIGANTIESRFRVPGLRQHIVASVPSNVNVRLSDESERKIGAFRRRGSVEYWQSGDKRITELTKGEVIENLILSDVTISEKDATGVRTAVWHRDGMVDAVLRPSPRLIKDYVAANPTRPEPDHERWAKRKQRMEFIARRRGTTVDDAEITHTVDQLGL